MKKMMEDQHSTFIQIPIVTDRCEKKCCSISTISLRLCKEITISTSQGMTIGPQQLFGKLIVFLTNFGSCTSPGVELVAI